jgi:DNA-directed RNA polymerase specialized sigma subunit
MSNELIKQYQETGDKQIGEQLLNIHKDYIRSNINKWSGSVPQIVLDTHGKHHALEAFKTFDPSLGVINTHLHNHLAQLSRLVYENQNAIKIPENQVMQIGRINSTKSFLTDEYGYEPSNQEIADHLHLPISHVEKIMKNQHADFVNDSDTEFQQIATSNTDISGANKLFAYHQSLPEDKRKQFESLTGFNNSQVLSPGQFGKKFKLKPYEVSRLKTLFAKGLK